MTVNDEPARAFGHIAAGGKDEETQNRADPESHSPAQIDGQERRIEQQQRRGGSRRRADPIASVDEQVDLPSHSRRYQFIDRRIDRRIFAANPEAGDPAARCHAPEVPGERCEKRSR